MLIWGNEPFLCLLLLFFTVAHVSFFSSVLKFENLGLQVVQYQNYKASSLLCK